MDETARWPREITEYLQRWILDERSPAFLITDRQARIVAKGGDLSRYGIQDANYGEAAAERGYFLEGLLPLDSPSSILLRVETAADTFANIHLFQEADRDCTVLLDVTDDVSERAKVEEVLRQTEEHLRQAEKMEALGRLAGGIAHDFNNLLTVILGYSDLLAESLTEERPRGHAREIIQVAKRAAAMTQQLLSFGRRQSRRVETLNLNAVISELEEPLRRLIEEDITLTVIPDSSLGYVEADRGQMEQVLVNLVVNARDAMPNGGAIEIRTENIEVDEDYAASHVGTQLHHGTHASFSVSDTGCGMDAETRARAFEPFFTSKPSGQGAGLGLSIVYGIVTQSGGEIVVTSEVGKGTRFQILLPSVERPPAAARRMARDAAARGTGTVLVVEDDATVRSTICQILTKQGYTVLESADASEALALCERHTTPIHLLVTDLIMPKMNGRELAARILEIHPETRVLYVSGYSEEQFDARGIEVPNGVFLRKPFPPAVLAERVREALRRPASAG